MDREIIIFVIEFIACSLIVYGLYLIFMPVAIIAAGLMLFVMVQSIENYLNERERKIQSRRGIIDDDGWL